MSSSVTTADSSSEVQYVRVRGNLIAFTVGNSSTATEEVESSQSSKEIAIPPPLPARFTFKDLRNEPYKWYRCRGWGLIDYVYVRAVKSDGEQYSKAEIKTHLVEGKDYYKNEDDAFEAAIALYGQEEDSEQDESDSEASPVAVQFSPETNRCDTTAETVEFSDASDVSESDSEEDYEDPYGAEEDYDPKKRKSGIKDGKLLGGISKLYTKKKKRKQMHDE
jgi:hypothetical protein